MKINGVPHWDTVQFIVEAIRELPTALALGMRRWVLSLHEGEEIEPGKVICMGPHHRIGRRREFPDWPCAEYLEADRAIDDLLNH